MERWPSIDPGELRHLIIIQKPIESKDSDGALLQAWVTYAQAYAKVDPYGGGEKWADASLASTNMHKFTIRYVAGIHPRMRISWDGRIFDIQNVENVLERNILQILKCLERLYDEAGVRVQ